MGRPRGEGDPRRGRGVRVERVADEVKDRGRAEPHEQHRPQRDTPAHAEAFRQQVVGEHHRQHGEGDEHAHRRKLVWQAVAVGHERLAEAELFAQVVERVDGNEPGGGREGRAHGVLVAGGGGGVAGLDALPRGLGGLDALVLEVQVLVEHEGRQPGEVTLLVPDEELVRRPRVQRHQHVQHAGDDEEHQPDAGVGDPPPRRRPGLRRGRRRANGVRHVPGRERHHAVQVVEHQQRHAEQRHRPAALPQQQPAETQVDDAHDAQPRQCQQRHEWREHHAGRQEQDERDRRGALRRQPGGRGGEAGRGHVRRDGDAEHGERQWEERRDCKARCRPGEGGGGGTGGGEFLQVRDVQVVGGPAGLQQQARPGDAAVEDVGLDEAGERPALQVAALQAFVEAHAAAGGGEAHAQLHVLDAGAVVRLAVAAVAEEDVAAHRAAAAPEGAGLLTGVLVGVVMKQVLEAADNGRVLGRVVVGAEDGVGRIRRREVIKHAADGVGVHQHVGIDEEEDRAAGDLRALVAGQGRSALPGHADEARPGRLGHGG